MRNSVSSILLAAVPAICLSAAGFASAQTVPFKVGKLKHLGEMPYVESIQPAGNMAAWRINQTIYLDVLQKAAPLKREDGLRATPRKDSSPMEPVSEISYKVQRLDARLLSLTVSFEGCGAYCEGQSMPFSFDARSGREVTSTMLFTPAGLKAVSAQVDRLQQTRVRNHLAKLQAAQKAPPGKGRKAEPAEEEDAVAAIEMYEGCLKGLQDPEIARFRSPDDEYFHLEPARVVFSRGRCSNHAMRALDELGDFSAGLTVESLLPHLSAYGRYLLQGGADVAAPATPLRTVLKGKVGTAPITLRLRSPGYEQSIYGMYFYDRFRTPIPLFGKMKDGVMELSEETAEGKEAPVLTLRIQGDSVKGEWTGGGKRLPVEAAP